MPPLMVIVADDLTGAADCGVACTAAGLDTVVVFSEGARAWDFAADVVAVDADTRRDPPGIAAAATEKLVREFCSGGNGPLLYKKIDSTLRGNFAVEIAAASRAYGALCGSAKGRVPGESAAPLTLVAPAFPAAGRTTRYGRMFVQGTPLEQSEVWRKEGIAGVADIPALLNAGAGLRTKTVGLEVVRAGAGPVADALARHSASGVEAAVCDAETEDDLAVVALAAARMIPRPVFAGSGGLARHLPAAFGLRRNLSLATGQKPAGRAGDRAGHDPARRNPSPLGTGTRGRGGLLFMVGSMSAVSHGQLERLAREPGVSVVRVLPADLRAGPDADAWRAAALQAERGFDAGQDVAVAIGLVHEINRAEGAVLSRALARLVRPLLPRLAGLFCTGGETARAVLNAAGIFGIRLTGEVEPGVPIGTGEGECDGLPIVTKAGAFGDSATLVRCRAALGGFPFPANPSLSFDG